MMYNISIKNRTTFFRTKIRAKFFLEHILKRPTKAELHKQA